MPPAGGTGSKVVVKEAKVKGKTILTATNGHTLYSLSVEKHGKFDCTKTSGCTALWHPLKVAAGVKPKGPVKLGTVKRPEGGLQVTYRGLPALHLHRRQEARPDRRRRSQGRWDLARRRRLG